MEVASTPRPVLMAATKVVEKYMILFGICVYMVINDLNEMASRPSW